MIVEGVKIVADALQDGTIGVNAQIPNVPTYSGHPTPPDIVGVETIFDSDRIAQESDPTDWPTLIVTVDTPWDVEGFPLSDHLDADNGGLAILYYTRKKDEAEALTDGAYTLRAALWSIVDLFDPSRAGSESDREEHGIQLIALKDHRLGSTSVRMESGALTAELRTRYEARELLP